MCIIEYSMKFEDLNVRPSRNFLKNFLLTFLPPTPFEGVCFREKRGFLKQDIL